MGRAPAAADARSCLVDTFAVNLLGRVGVMRTRDAAPDHHTKAGEARRTEPPESRERRARARSSDRDVAEQRGSSEPSFRIELKDVARILLYFTGEFRNKPEA